MQSKSRHRLFLIFTVGLLLLAGVAGALRIRAPFALIIHADPVGIKYMGQNDCSTAACHGANKSAPTYPGDCNHSESTVYDKFDLHARSFASKDGKKGLNNDLSNKIAKELGIKKASEDQRCLVCHALSGFSNGAAKARIPLNYPVDVAPAALAKKTFNVKQGVNCDGCHGPSDKYLPLHTVKGWTQGERVKVGSDALFNQSGLYDTKNLKFRANSCVSCHLKIDPELIKANHPELPFELDRFCHGEWMHWRPSGDYYGAKSWAMGQFVCVREAALQLAERVKGESVDQGLRLDSYKQVVAHLLMARHPAKWIAPEMEAELMKQLAAVNDNWKDAAKVDAPLQAMAKTADALADKLNPMKVDAAAAEQLLKCVAAEGEVAAARGFRSAQQYWYALTALEETNFLKGAAPEAKESDLKKKMKEDPKAKKIAELEEMATSAEAFKTPAFLAKVKEIMPLFGGGCASIPLPPNAPDLTGQPPPPPEPPKPETPKEVPKPEVPKPEVPKPEVPKPEVPKPEVLKPEVPKPEVPKPEVPKPEVPKPDVPIIPPPPPPPPPPSGRQFCPECGRPFPLQYKYCPVDGTKLARIVDDKKPE